MATLKGKKNAQTLYRNKETWKSLGARPTLVGLGRDIFQPKALVSLPRLSGASCGMPQLLGHAASRAKEQWMSKAMDFAVRHVSTRSFQAEERM